MTKKKEQITEMREFGKERIDVAFKKAAGHEKPYFVWGFTMQPKGNDPRLVECRVNIDSEGKPLALELHVITRKADHSARDEKVLVVDWPE